ncbi:MAG: AAA family ATPase [Muribaculaceae bacterium]|nr:AAA family ATPase [Muribaculaceae bacterium]
MKEAIIIKNFGPIRDLHIEEIKPFMLLIGPSASGKSTLMKLIGLFRYLYKYANIASYLRLSKIGSVPFKKQFKKLMEANGLAALLESGTHLEYIVTADSGNEYKLNFIPGRSVTLPKIKSTDLSFTKGIFISEFRNVISAWSGHGPASNAMRLGFYFNETAEDFNAAVTSAPNVFLPYFNMTFKTAKVAGGLTQYMLIVKDDDNREIPVKLREASSGMKTTTPLGLIVNYAANHFDFADAFERSVLSLLYRTGRMKDFKAIAELDELKKIITVSIEEPELSLDPDKQTQLSDYIVNSIFHTPHKDGRQYRLMMASHSPYLANHLNLQMARYESDPSTGIDPAGVDVLLVKDGAATSLIVTDSANRRVVDTSFLAEQINATYDAYDQLRP